MSRKKKNDSALEAIITGILGILAFPIVLIIWLGKLSKK